MTQKIVINNCFGGFSLSLKAVKRYLELKGKECYFYKNIDKKYIKTSIEEEGEEIFPMVFSFTKDFGNEIKEVKWKDENRKVTKEYNAIWAYHFSNYDIERGNLNLVKVVEELGEEANGKCAKLKIIEIPDDVEYEIDNYDGLESVHEVHRSWQ